MSVKDCLDNEGPCVGTVVGVSVFAVGLIAMLVCGILGSIGKLPLAPIGARIVIAIPAAIIVGYMSLVGATGAVACCK